MIKVSNNIIELPDGVCMACFNAQQRFKFPFLVYCRHKRRLAILHGPHEHATFECSPGELKTIVHKLKSSHPSLQN